MWSQATAFAVPEKLTQQETAWQKHVQPQAGGAESPGSEATSEEATAGDAGMGQEDHRRRTSRSWTAASAFNRKAPKEDVEKLKLLKGHVSKGQFVTKFRKVFTKAEMEEDLEFVRAKLGRARTTTSSTTRSCRRRRRERSVIGEWRVGRRALRLIGACNE